MKPSKTITDDDGWTQIGQVQPNVKHEVGKDNPEVKSKAKTSKQKSISKKEKNDQRISEPEILIESPSIK